MSEFPLNRRETFSVSMVLFIGFFYFLSLASALFQTQSIPINKLIGKIEIKFLFLGIFYWSGAISFFRVKNRGWVICTGMLLNFVVVVSQFAVTVTQSSFNSYAAIVLASFVLVLMAFLFMFNKETRAKFVVTNKSYLLVIGVYLVLLAITFLL